MDNKFEYNYSALQNMEIEKIRKKYTPKTSTESKLEQIKKLDKAVTSHAVGYALCIGIPGSLILGFGMSCCMVWKNLFALGIIVGLIGILMCIAAYPIYIHTIKKKRDEFSPQILKLSEEIEKGQY